MKKKRIVIKIGTNLITTEDCSLDTKFLSNLVEQIATLVKKGFSITIVTSGAVACGRKIIPLKKETKFIPYRQVLASVGQSVLMHHYLSLFGKYGITVAQVLLTNFDFQQRETFLNTKNILHRLLSLCVIPIVNENDVTSYEGIELGDNDNLASRLASMIDADTLIILSDVDGFFTDNPKKNPLAKLIPRVEKITQEIEKMAQTVSSKTSRGGMLSKLKSAEYAVTAGIDSYIVPGKKKDVLIEILEKERHVGTFFPAQTSRKDSRKKWMQAQIVKNAFLEIDEGAIHALCHRGASLLPSGIRKVAGKFKRGDVIEIRAIDGDLIGFGLVNYDSKNVSKIQGKRTEEIEQLLGTFFDPEVIHRDNLLIVKN
ncbi:glutamate 5-kinase [Candidatus Peregrinibacteria bacterium]|nr:glutamate 5-kinase [Candidatus Peregrinibacteria bacterium]